MATTQQPDAPKSESAPQAKVEPIVVEAQNVGAKTYFFPDLQLSVEANSMEEALEKINKEGK